MVDAEQRVAVRDGTEVAVSCGERAVGEAGDPFFGFIPATDRASRWTDRHPACLPVRPFRRHNAAVLITVGGLPAHPLLVHAVVVLIPLATLGALAVAVRAPWRRSAGPVVALLALAGAATATGAYFAGNQLAAYLEAQGQDPAPITAHGQLGLYTLVAAWPFAVLAVITAVVARRDPRPSRGAATVATATTSTATTVAAWLTALAGIAACYFTVVTGDSGSRMVWGFVTGG
jgi:hypothetical protein